MTCFGPSVYILTEFYMPSGIYVFLTLCYCFINQKLCCLIHRNKNGLNRTSVHLLVLLITKQDFIIMNVPMGLKKYEHLL